MIRERTILVGAGAVVALLVVAGCSSGSDTAEQPAGQTASSSVNETAPASAQAHNDTDITFAQHMIPHHQQAIEMSDILLAKQDVDPQVADLAKQIKGEQDPEIQQLQSWLNEWGNPPTPSSMEHGGHGDMSAMSGMLSDQELNTLRQAQGVDACRTFLTQMIAHHEGAIDMAQNEIDDGQYPAAIDMARSIVATQQHEIDTMKGILGTT